MSARQSFATRSSGGQRSCTTSFSAPRNYRPIRQTVPGVNGEKKPKNTANNASGAQGKGLICGHCGKPGHASISCYKWKAMWSWNDSENKGKNAKGKGKGDKGKVFECCLFLWRVSILHMPIQGKRNANAGGAAADAPAGKKRKFACFNCGKEDHKAADCPEPKKEQA